MAAPAAIATLDAARAVLRERFGHADFRPGQAEVIERVLAGVPTLAVMPTGAGKSLCFQLPALLGTGVAIVVSPLISLMKDQVDGLAGRGIAATFVNSSLGDAEREGRLREMVAGRYLLVYVAPERFRSGRFLDALSRVRVSLFAVDEAHCISAWGHDFRPDYARLGELRARLRPAMTVALTATATPEVRRDIATSLGMANGALVVTGFDRPELFLEVVKVADEREKAEQAAAVAAEGGPGIVYTATRRHAERLASDLAGRGLPAAAYHAGLAESRRTALQERFARSGDAVFVATNAFGMGVDKADVRFVVHADIPRSVEAYYQEVGRAGRDGRPARAVLLFNHSNVFLQEALIKLAHPGPELVRSVWELLREQAVVEQPVSAIAARLGANELEVGAAQRMLERAGHILRQGRGEGPAQVGLRDATAAIPESARGVFEALRRRNPGSTLMPVPVDALSAEAGVGPEQARRALSDLSSAGAIAYRRPYAGRSLVVVDRGIPGEALRVDAGRERRRMAQELLLLRRITAYAYTRSCRWRFVLGYFGAKSSESCGRCDRCVGAVPRRAPPRGTEAAAPARRPASNRPDTRLETLRRFEEGATIEQIARARQLRQATIARHVADLVRAGHALDVDRVVTPERRRLVAEVAPSCGFRPPVLKRALPDDFTYEEIMVALAVRTRDRRAGLR